MLEPELLKEIEKIQLRAGRQASEILSGNYISAFKGRGMEFDEVREYQFGDDVRTIDWNVTARMQTPYVKLYKEERQMTVLLAVDLSSSQAYGSKLKSKARVCAELVAVIAFLAAKNNDRVGLLIFSDKIESYTPPKKGRSHIWNLIRTIMTFEPTGKNTGLNLSLDFLLKLNVRKSLCFLVSDFLSPYSSEKIGFIAKKHKLVGVLVKDPYELKFPRLGLIALEDLESKKSYTFNSSSRSFENKFLLQQSKREEEIFTAFRKKGADMFSLSTDKSVVKPFVQFLRSKDMARVG